MSDNCHSHAVKATGSPNSIFCDNDLLKDMLIRCMKGRLAFKLLSVAWRGGHLSMNDVCRFRNFHYNGKN